MVFEGLLSFDMNNKLIQFVAHDADSGVSIDIDTARDGEGEDVGEILNRVQKVLESERGGRNVEDVEGMSMEHDKKAGHSEGGGDSIIPAVGVKGDLHRGTAGGGEAGLAGRGGGGGGAAGVEWLQLYSMVLSSALSTGVVRTVCCSAIQYSVVCSVM